jgi:acetylglutamate kinase
MTSKKTYLFKYGGNAMTDERLKEELIGNVLDLKRDGHQVVIVHGGGPFIKNILKKVRVTSQFIDGHRKTTPEALRYVEMALKGEVNGSLVNLINRTEFTAVGLSGKDGKLVTARKRFHKTEENGTVTEHDLGQVGDVASVNTRLIEILLESDYIPVITCLASDSEGADFNINGDMFAGHIAGAIKADEYVVLTDVDGLFKDINKPETLIKKLTIQEIKTLSDDGIIVGGMIPKVESCAIALNNGASSARIINGTKPDQITDLKAQKETGTHITAE